MNLKSSYGIISLVLIQVGGYRVVYDGLTLATIRGAGHEVPKYQSGRAFTLLNYFLNSK